MVVSCSFSFARAPGLDCKQTRSDLTSSLNSHLGSEQLAMPLNDAIK